MQLLFATHGKSPSSIFRGLPLSVQSAIAFQAPAWVRLARNSATQRICAAPPIALL
jgi:hypothetical protein